MKYFIIEIEKPIDLKGYRLDMQSKINNSEFQVVKVCASFKDAEKELIPFIRSNIKNQKGLHYEIIQGDGSEGFDGLKKQISNFYKRLI